MSQQPEFEGIALIQCNACRSVQAGFFLFCGQCGQNLAKSCAKCHSANPQNFKFCGLCGEGFDGILSNTHLTPIKPTLPDTPLPQSAVARMSELRQVVIIFCDLCGFTALSEKLEPEEVSNIINPLFSQLNNRLVKYGGTIEKFIGDAIMALFGVPISHEDDAERALLAALEMRQIIESYCSKLKLERDLDLNMRIGMNIGEIVAGSVIDEKGDQKYTVLGDAINVAARIEQNARPGHVLVAEALYQITKENFSFAEYPPIQAKGKSELLQVYELKGLMHHSQRSRGLQKRKTPLVGRKREMDALMGLYSDFSETHLQCFALIGESGLGKSRLVSEFAQFWLEKQGTIIKATSPSYSSDFSYFLLKSLLKNILNLDEQVSLEQIKVNIRNCLAPLPLDNTKLLTESFEYLLLQEPRNPLHLLDAEHRQFRLFQALAELLMALADHAPLLFILDDLQWADRASLEWLLYFKQYSMNHVFNHPFCIAATWRDDAEAKGLESLFAWTHALELEPLSTEEAEQLLCHLLEIETPPSELKKLFASCLEKAAGNPYFIEEVFKELTREKLLTREKNSWKLSGEFDDWPLPESLQSLTISYFDRLPSTHRQLLHIASVMGRKFSRIALHEISELKQESFDVIVYDLLQWEYFFEEKNHLRFTKTLVQEILYQTQLKTHKKERHEKIGLYLEANLNSSELYEHLEDLAHHFQKSTNHEKAVSYLYLAAQKARALYSNQQAKAFFQHALKLLQENQFNENVFCLDLNNENWVSELQFTLKIKTELIDLALLQGDYDEAHVWIDELLSWIDKKDIKAGLFYKKGRVYEKQSEWNLALEAYGKGQSLLEEDGSLSHIQLCNGSAWVAYRQGNYDEAVKYAQKAMSLMQEEPHMKEIAYAQNVIGVIHYQRKEWDQALKCYKKSLAIQERISDIWGKGNSLSNMGSVYVMTHQWDKAKALFQDSYELRKSSGDLDGQAVSCNNLGHIYQEIGDFEQALQYIEQALNIYLSLGNKFGYTVAYCNLGIIHTKLFQLEKAESNFKRGLLLIQELELFQILPEVNYGLIELYLLQGQTNKAKSLLSDMTEDAAKEFKYLLLASFCDFQTKDYASSLQSIQKALAFPESKVSEQDRYLLNFARLQNCYQLNTSPEPVWKQEFYEAQQALEAKQLQWLAKQLEAFFDPQFVESQPE